MIFMISLSPILRFHPTTRYLQETLFRFSLLKNHREEISEIISDLKEKSETALLTLYVLQANGYDRLASICQSRN